MCVHVHLLFSLSLCVYVYAGLNGYKVEGKIARRVVHIVDSINGGAARGGGVYTLVVYGLFSYMHTYIYYTLHVCQA